MSELVTRRPTGQAPWPIMLIAGVEKSGKSWACAEASGSARLGRTLWISVGEDDPDEYGQVPGADFEIVEHDGTYPGILKALRASVNAEPVDGKPTLIVFDPIGRVWEQLSDMAQQDANRRALMKAQRQRRQVSLDDDFTINMDQWNLAKDRWGRLLYELRRHQGPSIVTARLEQTTVVDSRGEPTREKTQKVKAEKNLPFEVGVVVEMPARGEAWIRGLRSVKLQLDEARKMPDFSVEKLWHAMLGDGPVGVRHHSAVVLASPERQQADAQASAQAAGELARTVQSTSPPITAPAPAEPAARMMQDSSRIRTGLLRALAQKFGEDNVASKLADLYHCDIEYVTIPELQQALREETNSQEEPSNA